MFGFWLLRSAIRSAGRGNGRTRGVQRSEIVKGNGIPAGVIAVIVMISLVVTGVMMVTGLKDGLLTACIIVFPVLIFGGWFFVGVSESSKARAQLRELPSLPNPETELHRTQAMRERVSQLSAVKVPERPSPAPETVAPARPEPVAAVPRPRTVKTYRQLLGDRELTERMRRIAGILLADCPVCEAGEAEFCSYRPDAMVSVLDRQRQIVVHHARIGHAVKTGTAKVTDVVAQYDGHVPDSVWETAL